ncbi:hypothetical protein [Nostoc sp. WHI]|uniref:hypothetical protein n=1 Tax=Nostoc sp. WHI TaxID=2650611 RepID=UPI0018C721FA|nr:hypothetical protein [Nostoc sp. WHI]MBG1270700.1 hypothetical protein [Nostoc sp. WHI]
MGTNSSQILPTSEVQVRPLAKLEPQQQPEAWQQAVEQVLFQKIFGQSLYYAPIHFAVSDAGAIA